MIAPATPHFRHWALALWATLSLNIAQAEVITIGGTGAGVGTMRLLAQAYAAINPQDTLNVLPSMGSGGGLKALQAGAVQLAVISRPLKEAEQQAGLVAREYGRTPFVFTVQARNKIEAITTATLADIYAGKLERWPDGSRIRLVMRPAGDSDNELLKAALSDLRGPLSQAEQRSGMLFAVTDQEAADDAEKVEGALGTSTLALLMSEKRALKALALDGVKPDVKAAAAGRYPMYKTLYLVTARDASPGATAFLKFMASPTARDILGRNGHWVQP